MKSPRFVLREKEIREVFASSRLRHTWKRKVRAKLRSHVLPDPIEHLDFHLNLTENCRQLEQLVCSGHYLPAPAHRVLMGKSRGLCRQIVIPNVRDALVLQCLSDALYDDIRGKAPSKRAFFEPEDHTFSALQESILREPAYGSLRAWLDFQRELFKFPKNHLYVIITDIANYYDHMSYVHLRNIIASKIEVREAILDMLIFVLSGLLWQPDYAPRVDVGLPQMSIDAARILAHCFLYELDEFLEKGNINFVRYMDDIDIGVDSIDDARRILRDLDLVLHTRQVRLNTGKTVILSHLQAERHFRVRENYLIKRVVQRLDQKLKANLPIDREKKYIRRALHVYYRKGKFDDGNGEKILKILLNISKRIDSKVDHHVLNDILRRRPGARAAAFRVIECQRFTPRIASLLMSFLSSRVVVDDWTYLESADALVHMEARTKPLAERTVPGIVERFLPNGFFGAYASLWLLSKYGTVDQIHQVLVDRI